MAGKDFFGNQHYLLFLLLFGAYNVLFLRAEEEIIKSGICKDFFQHSVVEDGAPSWVTDGSCHTCNGDNNKKSWFYTNFLGYKDAKLVHARLILQASACQPCQSKSVNIYVIYEDLTKLREGGNDLNTKLIRKFNSVPLVKEIEMKTVDKKEHHNFTFRTYSNSSGVSLVFLSEGGCFVIFSIKITYLYCKETSDQPVALPRVISPATGSHRVNANCSSNSVSSGGESFGLCNSNGSWSVRSSCSCKKGFTLGSNGCESCQEDKYKDNIGNGPCFSCPSHSKSSDSIKCECEQGYHRFVGENYTHACHGIPSPVKSIKVDKSDKSVNLKWFPPSRTGGDKVFYDIECFECEGNECKVRCQKETYSPSKYNLTQRNVKVENLEPNTTYQFVIYSKNANSYRISREKWESARTTIETSKTGQEGTTPSVSSDPAKASSDLPLAVIIAVPVVVVILVIIIIILAILLKRRKIGRRLTIRRKNPEVAFPLIDLKNYIDPTTYDDPERAVSEFAKELNRDQIKFESVIGGGEFGDVYKGTLKRAGEPPVKVAIKTLKPGSTQKNRKDFLLEASIMGQFKNLNVISLEGVVTKSTPLLIVTEFMDNGSLDDYLKNNDGLLKPLQLLGMARGVASGMAYLAAMHFVHRDLAARNVLVNVNLACKVADFGLSRDVGENEESEYETQGGRIPVRWTAPECIRHRKFSTASDVWSYGILLWEIMSFAERPYWEWSNLEVMERVEGGYRLPPPMNCPKTVHQLMVECWAAERTERPAFPDIVKILDEWIRSPEKLNEEKHKMRKAEPLDFRTFESVKDWLEAFKMGMYASNFTKAGYRNLSDVAGLSESELLSKVGVRLVGHRHKIYQRIKEVSEQMNISREQSVRI